MSIPILLKRYIRAKMRRGKKGEKDKKELTENAQKENKIYNKKLFPQAEKCNETDSVGMDISKNFLPHT